MTTLNGSYRYEGTGSDDSLRPFYCNIRIETPGKAARDVTVNDGGDIVVSAPGITQGASLYFDKSYIQAIKFIQVMGRSGLGEDGNLQTDMGNHAGTAVLFVNSGNALLNILMTRGGNGSYVYFSFGYEDEPVREYKTVATEFSYSLRPDGVVVTIFFSAAELVDTYIRAQDTAYSDTTDGPVSNKQADFVAATRTYEKKESGVKRVTLGIRNNKTVYNDEVIYSNIRLKPHQVFLNIAKACGWPTEGVYGGKVVSCVEESPYAVTKDTAYTVGYGIHAWVVNQLCTISRTIRNHPYIFYFAADEVGKTVAHFHGAYWDPATQKYFEPDQEYPAIYYGASVSNSQVISCEVTDPRLLNTLAGQVLSVGTDSASGHTLTSLTRTTPSFIESAAGHVPSFDGIVKGITSRDADDFETKTAILGWVRAGYQMNLSLQGTKKYVCGSFFRFFYLLPDGTGFPALSGTVFQIVTLTFDVNPQGYVTVIEGSAINVNKLAFNSTVISYEKPPGRGDKTQAVDVRNEDGRVHNFSKEFQEKYFKTPEQVAAEATKFIGSSDKSGVNDFLKSTVPITPVPAEKKVSFSVMDRLINEPGGPNFNSTSELSEDGTK